MGFKGYENSECPLAGCPKNCEHSHTKNDTSSVARFSTEDPENITRARLTRYNSSQSIGSTLAADDTRAVFSAGPSRTQSNITTPNASPPHEKQKAKEKERIYRKAPWQPSLAAGGPVDLLATFTPTPYGTFSFGGKSNKTSGTAKITPKKVAPRLETLPFDSSATVDAMDPRGSSTAGSYMPPITMNVPTSAQVGRATGSCETPVTPQADSAGDEGVSAVPLAAPSTNTPLAPSTQNAVEDEPVTPRAAAQVETDPLGKAPEGMHNIPHANAKCTEDMNGAANGLTNGSAGPAETLFARRRAETRGSNPMAESSLVGAATVPIYPDDRLRRENANPAPLMDATRPAPPSSKSSYSRRLSEAARGEIEKVQALQRRDTEGEDS